MSSTADVIVVGAGIHGASTAFHIAQRGLRVLVLERRAVASGATGTSSGFVRMHYDLAAESALAWRSFDYFQNWSEVVGGESGFTRTGFIKLVRPEHEASLRGNVGNQQQLGINTSIISADDVQELVPTLVTDDFSVAAYEPDSGYADPTSAASSLLAAARARGASLKQHCAVERIVLDGERVAGVQTAEGVLSAPVVVLAAGAWSGQLAATAGVDIPVSAWHHDTGLVELPAGEQRGMPVVIDDINAVYFRPEGGSLALVGLEDGNRIDELPDDDSRSDPNFVEHAVDRLIRRAPAFANAQFRGSHGGTDGMTPDQRGLIGRYGPDGLVIQTGFSGTGFKTAPAVGLAVAELIAEGESRSVDIAPFHPGRFAAGRPLEGEHPYGDFWR